LPVVITMPSLAPIPAPLAELAERHRALNRMADRHGLSVANPEHHAELMRLMGWGDEPLALQLQGKTPI
jgi:hypothetical protein